MSKTIEISRELAERLTNKYRCTVSQLEIHKKDIDELRALLAKSDDFNCLDGGKCGNGGYCDACPHTKEAAPVVERQEPVAWRHTMHFERGCGYRFELTDSPENPFGKPDVDYDKSFRVTCEPLYTSPPAPVAVVLPTLDDFADTVENIWGFGPKQLCLLNGEDLKHMWIGCLDKVKELNQ